MRLRFPVAEDRAVAVDDFRVEMRMVKAGIAIARTIVDGNLELTIPKDTILRIDSMFHRFGNQGYPYDWVNLQVVDGPLKGLRFHMCVKKINTLRLRYIREE